MNSRAPLAALLLIVAVGGCVRPVAPALPAELTAAEVARLLAAPLDRVQTLQGSGTLRVVDRAGTSIGDLLLAVKADAGLRLDAIAPFGAPVLTASVTREGLLLLDHRRRLAISGPADAATAARLLRIEAEPLLLVDLARGGVRRDEPPWAPTPPGKDEDPTLWWFASGDWRVGVDPEQRRPARLSAGASDPLFVAWRDVRAVDQVAVACRLEVARPAQRQTMVVQLSDVQLNQPLDPTLLRPAIPAGWRTQRLDEPERSGD